MTRVFIRFFFLCFIFFGLSAAPVVANDVRELAEKLEARALSGDARSAYKLGLLFSDGKKIDPDYFTALEWFKRSAEGGYIKAMSKVADMYLSGEGVQPDLNAAISWFTESADKGQKDAMVKLGAIYLTQNNDQQSAHWFKKAAILGDSEAQRELGRFYLEGRGVRFDLIQAYGWLKLAARQRDGAAKSLQRGIEKQKGLEWADQVRRDLDDRRILSSYWNVR